MIITTSMAWTEQDADAVRDAIKALASGTRVVTVNFAGPPARSVTYGAANLGELRDLLAEMEQSSGSANRTRVRRVAFSKGFRRGC